MNVAICMGKPKKNEKEPKQSNIRKRSSSTKETLDVQSKQQNNAHRSVGNKIES